MQCYKNSLSHVCGIKISQKRKLYHIIISISSFTNTNDQALRHQNHPKRNINSVLQVYLSKITKIKIKNPFNLIG